MSEELVAIIDDAGVPIRAEPRSVMRAQNLPHLVVTVLVRRPDGQIYVHRRSDDKDVFPGMYDCFAAGCVTAGESPEEAASRELAEELGVAGVELRPLLSSWYRDESTHHLCHTWEVTYDGPVVHQEAEIASGGWMTVSEVRELLADPARPMVPDGRVLVERLLAEGVLD